MITPPRKAMFIHMRQSHLLLSSLTYNGIIFKPSRVDTPAEVGRVYTSHIIYSHQTYTTWRKFKKRKKNPSRSSSPLHLSLLKSFTPSPSSHCSFFFRFYSLLFSSSSPLYSFSFSSASSCSFPPPSHHSSCFPFFQKEGGVGIILLVQSVWFFVIQTWFYGWRERERRGKS